VFRRAVLALTVRLPPAPSASPDAAAQAAAAWARVWGLAGCAAAVPSPTALASPERDAFEAECAAALGALGVLSDAM
jgi:hypothetical protein